MATGKSGYIEFTPSVLWAAVRVYYEETYDIVSNTSDLMITSIQVKSTSYQDVDYYIDGVVKVGGTEVLAVKSSTGNVSVNVNSCNTWYPIKKDGQVLTASLEGIAHDNSGTGSVEIELTGNNFLRFAFYTVDGENGNGWGVKEAQTITLTDIPRASSIAATDANVGAVSTVTVTRRNTGYSHSVAFSFGELSGWLDGDGTVLDAQKKLTATTIPFTIPESFYTQLTDTAYGSCTLLCTTYSGDTQIGEVQEAAFRVTADLSACAPVVTGTVEDVNAVTVALTEDVAKLIRYASNALCTISAEARQGASICSKTIGGVAVEENSRTIAKVESGTIRFTATDSRGYSAAATVAAELIPYVPLTLNAVAKRTDPTSGEVLLSVKGNVYNGTFGAAENTLTLGYAVGEQTGEMEAVMEGNAYTASATLTGLDYRSSHSITVTAEDRISGLSGSVTVGKGIPVFDWGENDFAFHVPVELENGFTVQGKALVDQIYPVGSVYMSGSDTDPGTLFGGTWSAVENELGLNLWKRI